MDNVKIHRNKVIFVKPKYCSKCHDLTRIDRYKPSIEVKCQMALLWVTPIAIFMTLEVVRLHFFN